jgi:hypothetical protein
MRINPVTEYRQRKASDAHHILQGYLKKTAIFIVLSIEIYFFIKMLI